MTKKITKGVMATLAVSLLAAGCGAGGGSANTASFSSKPSHGGTITAAFFSNIATLDPAQWSDMTSMYPMQEIYQTLVGYSHKGATLVPEAAASYTVSPNGLVYTFKLRPGLKFSNGDPVTAADVKYSLDRVTGYNASGTGPAPYGFAYAGIVGYNKWYNNGKKPAASVQGLSGVKVLSSNTVQITLKSPEAYFLNTLALMSAAILDKNVASKYSPTTYMLHTVGSGPFMVQSWNQGHKLVLVPNPQYAGPGHKPYISKLVLNENVSWKLQLLRFQRGQQDLMIDGPFPSSVYSQILNTPKLKPLYHKISENGIVYLAFNTTKPPFNNKDVRLAVNYAINKQLIAKDITNGRGQIAGQSLPPKMPGYNPAIQPFPYSPAKAKALLKKAGYKSGQGPSVTFIYPSSNPGAVRTAQIVQSELQSIGFTVNLHAISQLGSYWPYEDTASNPWNIAWTDWFQDYPDPQDFMFNLLSKQAFGATNVGNWTDPTFQKLISKADGLPASQDTKRWALYKEAETIAHNQAAWAYLYYYWNETLVQPWIGPATITDYIHPVSTTRFNRIWTNHTK